MADQHAAGLSGNSISVHDGSLAVTVGGVEYLSGKWWEVPAVCLLMLALAVCSTYPLIHYFDTGIPYAPFGGAKVWNRSGDQIQLMYWFWLVKENFMGAVPFDSNPFEFNMPIPHATSGLNTIPLAFLYMLFSPFGDVAAYNATIFSSYVLAGLFMYLLVREYCGSRTGALLAAVIFTLAPSRIKGFTAGHGYGFLFFCYPFILYYLEKGIRSRKIRYGIVSGIGLLGLAMLEPHLIYYICVFLGLYIPVRVLSLFPVSQDIDVDGVAAKGMLSWSASRSLLMIWGAGIAVVLYSQFLLSCRDHDPLFNQFFWWVVGAYPLVLVLLSLCFAASYQRLSRLSFSQSLAVEAGSLLPLFLFFPMAWWSCEEKTVATGTVVVVTLTAVTAAKIWLLRQDVICMLRTLGQGLWNNKKAVLPIVPLIFSMGAVVGWIAFTKLTRIASTIAGGGRTLSDVGLFSAHLSDLTSSISAVYIGIVPAAFATALLLVMLYSVLRSRQNTFATEQEFLRLFYCTVGFCCLLLALGLSFGKSSLYILFYHYFPFFNYPRVSDRIITMVLFALAIVVGFVVCSVQKRCKNKISLAAVTLLVLMATGFQLKDFNVFKPMGINILDRGQDIYTYVKEHIGDGLLLEIPLWPGDSHQSSLYQHYIMLDRVKRVNGCSPLVLKEYIETVFNPLAPINQGRFNRKQYDLLRKMGVKYITVHNNRDIFLKKVSPFVPLTTVRRLKNSPYLEFVPLDNAMYFKTWQGDNSHRLFLFRVKEHLEPGVDNTLAWYEMPYFYDVNWRLHHQTGKIVQDNEIGKRVFQATAGETPPGFLVYGPYDIYSPGEYQCTFTLSISGSAGERLARLEVAQVTDAGNTILAQTEMTALDDTGEYVRKSLDFSIVKNTKLEFRVFYYGKGRVRVEKIVVNTKGHDKPLYHLEAENMVGNIGQLVFVQGASQGKVVESGTGKANEGDMVYGPNRTYRQGHYKVQFYLRTTGGEQQTTAGVVAVLSVTDGQNIHTYAQRDVHSVELLGEQFTKVELSFELSRENELSFHVRSTGMQALQLDTIEIVKE